MKKKKSFRFDKNLTDKNCDYHLSIYLFSIKLDKVFTYNGKSAVIQFCYIFIEKMY